MIRKITLILSPLISLVHPQIVRADSVEDVFGKVAAPSPVAQLGPGGVGISTLLNRIIELIFIAGALIFVFMFLTAALQWIMSGGDKEKVSGARDRITNAIIGIVLLAISFLLIKVLGQVTGFTFFKGQNNP